MDDPPNNNRFSPREKLRAIHAGRIAGYLRAQQIIFLIRTALIVGMGLLFFSNSVRAPVIIMVALGYNILIGLFYQKADVLWGTLFNDKATFQKGVFKLVDRMSDSAVQDALNKQHS